MTTKTHFTLGPLQKIPDNPDRNALYIFIYKIYIVFLLACSQAQD